MAATSGEQARIIWEEKRIASFSALDAGIESGRSPLAASAAGAEHAPARLRLGAASIAIAIGL
jgi:hypothetical protein